MGLVSVSSKKVNLILVSLMGLIILALMLALMSGTSRAAGPIYVDIDAAGPGTGADWSNAYTNVQDALKVAVKGDEIWVAEGLYYADVGGDTKPDDQWSYYKINAGVSMYGGFAGTETTRDARNWNDHVTVLSGDLTQNDITDADGIAWSKVNLFSPNSHHVVAIFGDDTILDGFSVTGSQGTAQGGGIWGNKKGATLSHLTVAGNAGVVGGGIAFIGPAEVKMNDITLVGNSALAGGGMGLWDGVTADLNNITFRDNRGVDAGGLSISKSGPITLTNSIFIANRADNKADTLFPTFDWPSSGGGMQIYNSNLVMNNVLFHGNYAKNVGGAISNWGSNITLNNVTISGNDAAGHNNHQGARGGAIFNITTSGSPTIDMTIRNSIIWNNASQHITGDPDDSIWNLSSPGEHLQVNTSYSVVAASNGSGPSWVKSLGTDGGNNLDTDPKFVQTVPAHEAPTTVGNLHLQFSSPAINNGNDAVVTTKKDLDGKDRIFGSAVDRGPYEQLTTCPASGVTVLHVKQGATGHSGASWVDAFGSLHDALALADHCSGITDVWVAGGTYYPDVGDTAVNDDQTATFPLQNNLGIYGGFAGSETTRSQRDFFSNVTILSGDIDNETKPDILGPDQVVTTPNDIKGSNSYHVVVGSGTNSSAVLDGFTITGGQATGSAASKANNGGGLLNDAGSPTLANLVVTGNEASNDGGGMANFSGHPSLTNVVFKANQAAAFGGGLYNAGSHPTLTNVAISGNAAVLGGGVLNTGSDPDMINVTITGNQATSGISVSGSSFNLPMAILVIPTGGGMLNMSHSRPDIRNSIIYNNKDDGGTGALGANITNNGVDNIPSIAYSMVQGANPGGAWNDDAGLEGPGNAVDTDPLFAADVNPANAPTATGDLELQHASTLIDQGKNSYNSSTTDPAGNPRIVDGDEDGHSVIDMGAYEHQLLGIVKTASKTSAQVGETITYNYVITNKSALTIDNLKAIDNKLGEVTLGTTTLAAGAGTSGSLTYTIKDTDPNPLINVVAVTGDTPTKVTVGGSDSASVTLLGHAGNPDLSAKITADKTSAATGEIITYTYLVTNTGDKLLDNISATDSFGPVDLGKTSLPPHETATVDVKHTVTASDLPTPLINKLTVKASPPVGDDITAEDQVSVDLHPTAVYLPILFKK